MLYTQYKHVLVVFFAAARAEVTKVRAMLFWLLWFLAKARAGRGAGEASPPFFWKKKGIFGGKRIFDWRTLPKYPNLWLVRFDPISQGENKREWGTLFSLGKPQNDFLYKTDLSRGLSAFSPARCVVYGLQKQWSLFIKVLKSPGSYDFFIIKTKCTR